MQKSGTGEWTRRGGLVALMVSSMIAAGCGGGGGGSAAPTQGESSGGAGQSPAPGPIAGPTNPTPTTPGANAPPTISATPVSQIGVGVAYKLAPTAQDPDGDTLAFSIENRPTWASFNTATGELTGNPGAQHIGSTADVVISVSDGATSVALPAFSITVVQAAPPVAAGSGVALSWDVPTVTVDGEVLNDLTGYRIHYGQSETALTEAIEIPSAGVNQYVVQNLEPGKYYFAVRAVTASGARSEPSNVIAREIG